MITGLLIAGAAGSASALMFASLVSGALISLLLFYLAPLPLMVAAIGWGATSAAIGGTVASAGLGSIFGLPYSIAFILTVALPAWWLGHLALLGRPVVASAPVGNGVAMPPPLMEWYPVGRLLVWVAGFAALTTIAALLTLGTDSAAITGALRRGLMRIMGTQDAANPIAGDSERAVNALVTIAPAAAAIVAMMTLTLNLWLAAKITATSGRLQRPWPQFTTIALPPMTLAILSLTLACCFAGGLFTIFGQIASAALLMAYAFTGFATLHTLTLAIKSRALVLSGIYAVVLVFGWPILALVCLGLADAAFGLRQRYLQRRAAGPPLVP